MKNYRIKDLPDHYVEEVANARDIICLYLSEANKRIPEPVIFINALIGTVASSIGDVCAASKQKELLDRLILNFKHTCEMVYENELRNKNNEEEV
jgi:hypothetical protein